MDELDAIRQRKIQELQKQQADASYQEEAKEAQRAQQEQAIERLLQQILDAEARERLTRVRMSRPDFAELVIRQLVALAQSGRLQKQLTDADLRDVLTQLQPKDRDTTITRK